jgi:hypothetical protein
MEIPMTEHTPSFDECGVQGRGGEGLMPHR